MSEEKDLERRLLELETRLEALEAWRTGMLAKEEAKPPVAVTSAQTSPAPEREKPEESPRAVAPAASPRVEPQIVPPVDFDLALVGRLLIVLGGAFLLRAITESGVLPPAVGVAIGLAYALTWLVVALRPSVARTSAAYHGLAGILAAYPLLFEAARKFEVLGAWSSALALSVVTALWVLVTWRKLLHGLTWVATIGAVGTTVLLMAETSSMVPFVLYLTALGVTTLWMGYMLGWYLLRWPVAAIVDATLLLMAFLVVTDRIAIPPVVALITASAAFAAYLVSFVVRNLVRERNVVMFDVVQTLGALVCGLGGAMWIAGAKDTLEFPFALAILALAAVCYGASFVFIPRHITSPNSFFFYSTLALVLVLGAGTFIAEGLPSSIMWSAFALTSTFLAGRYEKPVLAVHSAIYLVAGLIGAGLLQDGFRLMALKAGNDWSVSWAGAGLVLAASVVAAGIHPIERKGSYSIWSTAKITILLVLGWTGATMLMALLGRVLHGAEVNPGMIAFERTAILSGLTVLTAWLARYPLLAPGRRVANILMILLAMKLIWDDLRAGTPLTMFLSFACVGVALILATKLRKSAVVPSTA